MQSRLPKRFLPASLKPVSVPQACLPFPASLGEMKIQVLPFSPKALRFRLVLLSDFLETHCGKNQVDLLVGGILVQA